MKRLVEFAHRNINSFPAERAMCENVSPLSFVTGRGVVDYKNIKLDFGSHVELFKDNEFSSKTNNPRSIPALCMGFTGYHNPGMKFVSLVTGRRIRVDYWKELPIPQWFIDRVHELAEQQQQPHMSAGIPFIARIKNMPDIDINDNKIDENQRSENSIIDENQRSELDDGIDDQSNEETGKNEPALDPNIDVDDNIMYLEEEPHANETHDEHANDLNENGRDHDEDNGKEADKDDVNITPKEWPEQRRRSRRIANLPPINPFVDTPSTNEDNEINKPSFAQIQANKCSRIVKKDDMKNAINDFHETNNKHVLVNAVVGYVMAQLSARKGMQQHGEKAIKALCEEFLQQHDMNTFTPACAQRLSKEDKKKALKLLSHIENKRDGRVKGRNCADGRK